MPAFPSYAKLLRNGFAEERESALLRSEMESGPPKQARVRSRVMVTRPVAVLLDSVADYIAFKAWFAEDIAEGALWFDWLDPVDGVTKSVRFVGGGLKGEPVSSVTGHWTLGGLRIEGWGV